MQPTHPARSRVHLIALCAAVYFGWVLGVGFLLGSVRVLLLVPRLGERAAELAEMPLMFLAIFLAAGHVVRRYGPGMNPAAWAAAGLGALALLVAAELLLALALAGRSLAEYIASPDPVSGSVYLVILVVFAAMPWLRRGHATQ